MFEIAQSKNNWQDLHGILPIDLSVRSQRWDASMQTRTENTPCNHCRPWEKLGRWSLHHTTSITFGLWLAVIIIPQAALKYDTENGTLDEPL